MINESNLESNGDAGCCDTAEFNGNAAWLGLLAGPCCCNAYDYLDVCIITII